jgi:hypothetical protein
LFLTYPYRKEENNDRRRDWIEDLHSTSNPEVVDKVGEISMGFFL